jgi:hypothetical protein
MKSSVDKLFFYKNLYYTTTGDADRTTTWVDGRVNWPKPCYEESEVEKY